MERDLFTRSKHNPILKPNKRHNWESLKVYNTAAIYEYGKYYLFYRGVGKNWISSIGYAVSTDGEKFQRFKKPTLVPKSESEKRGVEDPRITKIDDTYYLTYTAAGDIAARLHLATSNDLRNWKRHGFMLKDWNINEGGGFMTWKPSPGEPRMHPSWSKAGAIFPSKIKNKFWMLFGDCNVWLAYSDSGVKWESIEQPFIRPRKGKYFDNYYVEMGPPPIKTDSGWLVLYHGINRKKDYKIGFLIIDLKNPKNILYRSDKPIFRPQETYELSGIVDVIPGGYKKMKKMTKKELDKFIKKAEKKGIIPKVTFCCGALVVNGVLRIYYGASDTFICTATAKLDDILKTVK